MMVDLESATIQLYEDASLTEDLVDADAQLLLKWGEARLKPLVEQYASDEEGFESAFKQVRSFIKRVNRFVGRRQDATPEEQQEMFARVLESAQTINPDLQTEEGANYAQSQAAQSTTDAIQSLLNWVTPPASIAPSTGTPTAIVPSGDTPTAIVPTTLPHDTPSVAPPPSTGTPDENNPSF